MQYNILICFGTRPEWIKLKPVIKAMKEHPDFNPTVLFTGQHDTLVDEAQWDIMLDMPDLPMISNRLSRIFSEQFADIAVNWDKYDAVLVQGDTASVFAMGVQAFHHKIPLIHLEAGMRTHALHDPYPEEGYRQMISRIVDLHLCPTETERKYLINESIDPNIIRVVGNTVLDNIKHLHSTLGNTIYITMHRRENEYMFEDYFKSIVKIADMHPQYEFIFPMHPSPMVQRHKSIFDGSGVQIVDPIPHNEFSVRLSNARAVITDSGGVQEEAVFLRKRVFVCRNVLERNLSDGIYEFGESDPEELIWTFEDVIDHEDIYTDIPCPYGDGNSSKKVLDEIMLFFGVE